MKRMILTALSILLASNFALASTYSTTCDLGGDIKEIQYTFAEDNGQYDLLKIGNSQEQGSQTYRLLTDKRKTSEKNMHPAIAIAGGAVIGVAMAIVGLEALLYIEPGLGAYSEILLGTAVVTGATTGAALGYSNHVQTVICNQVFQGSHTLEALGFEKVK